MLGEVCELSHRPEFAELGREIGVRTRQYVEIHGPASSPIVGKPVDQFGEPGIAIGCGHEGHGRLRERGNRQDS